MKTLRIILAAALALAISQPAAGQTAIKPNGSPTELQADASGNLKTVTPAGSVAAGTADSGNPEKMGCVDAASTSAATTGVRSNVTCSDGVLLTVGTVVPYANAPADASAAQVGFVSSPTNYGVGFALGVAPQAYNGSQMITLRGDVNGLVVQKGLSSTIWRYSNGATGILSNTTTAVTIKTAAGASVRNYIDSCHINTTAFGASVPLAIRDGAGGTIIFALNVPTVGFLQPVNIVFETPLQGTANTLLEVVTTTANTTGTVWVNCQGHTGS